MSSSKTQRIALHALCWLGVAVASGCAEPDESQVCDPCGQGQYGYICKNTTPSQLGCAASPLAADMQCPGGVVAGEECGGGGSGGQGSQDPYSGWDPDDFIYYDRQASEFVIDKALIGTIAADGHVLLAADRARLMELPGGYYEIQSVGRDDFAYHLGLRSGDKILSANGIELKTMADYVAAITALRNATALTITYERSGTTMTEDFRIE